MIFFLDKRYQIGFQNNYKIFLKLNITDYTRLAIITIIIIIIRLTILND